MNYNDFLTRQQQIKKLSIAEQKNFYEQLLKKKYDKPGNVFVGVTHRLDRPVSGIVVLAKTSKALARLNEMFRKGDYRTNHSGLSKLSVYP